MVDARDYHERTKHSPERLREEDFSLDRSNRPRPCKVYEDLPRVELTTVWPPQAPTLSVIAESDADPLAGVEQPAPEAPDRETLATLCYESTGVLTTVEHEGQEIRFRAASCTGKLYHVDCYLVCGDLDDLDPGVYHFDPATFSFDVLREGDFRGVLDEATGGQEGVANAPVTVVTTSTWWRNAWKYRARTYRHAFWDSGTLLANLLATAHALDYRAEVVSGFADRPVADLLGVDPEEEAPLELVPIGRGERVSGAPSVEPIDPDTAPLSEDVVEYPLIQDAWKQSALDDGEAAADWRARAERTSGLGRRAPGDGERVALDPVDHATASARPLHNTIRRRGSCREYAVEPTTRRKLGTVLDRATRGIPGDWNGTGLAFNDVYVLARNVEGVPAGSYHFQEDDSKLERVGDANRETMARLALGQEWAGDAHANVYLMSDVEAVVDELGNRGYRLAQLEAGIVLGRLYLATYAHRDLGGLGLTFFDDLVTEHLSPRAAGQTPTTLFALGRRADR